MDGQLPRALLAGGPSFISGGERSLYELATAAAVAGFDVELRGDLNAAILGTITGAAGVAPRCPDQSRRPRADDIVIVPEGYDIAGLAALHLSDSRNVVLALAPPGLSGWSFQAGWSLPSHLTVPLDQVGRPETFRAIAALGFSLWTNAHGIAEAGRSAGTSVTWLGTGTPVPFPPSPPKEYDLAVVESNRWHTWSEQIANELSEFSVLRIPARASTYSLGADLARARVLIWPSRVEGMSRIAREARGVGTVPVALDTNPFATLEDHGAGVVLVPDLATLRDEARRLLRDPERLAALSNQAVAGVRAQADWGHYVARVAAAVTDLADQVDAPARAVFGDFFDRKVRALQRQVAALEPVASRVVYLDAALADTRVRLQDSQAALAAAQQEVRAFRRRRIVRLVDRLARLRPKPRRTELRATQRRTEGYAAARPEGLEPQPSDP